MAYRANTDNELTCLCGAFNNRLPGAARHHLRAATATSPLFEPENGRAVYAGIKDRW